MSLAGMSLAGPLGEDPPLHTRRPLHLGQRRPPHSRRIRSTTGAEPPGAGCSDARLSGADPSPSDDSSPKRFSIPGSCGQTPAAGSADWPCDPGSSPEVRRFGGPGVRGCGGAEARTHPELRPAEGACQARRGGGGPLLSKQDLWVRELLAMTPGPGKRIPARGPNFGPEPPGAEPPGACCSV